MQNMNRLYRTFDLGSRHFISFFLFLGVFFYLLYSLVRISGDGAMAREKKSEKREEKREKET